MDAAKQLMPIVGGVLVIIFLPLIIVMALILGSISGLDDESTCDPGGSNPDGTDAGLLAYPTDPEHRDVSHGFKGEDGATHPGMDFDVPAGTVVRAAEAGKVIEKSGDLVKIDHTQHPGLQTWYKFVKDIAVSKDDTVTKGQEIAKSGSGDEEDGATGEHLHFEVRATIDGELRPVDPRGMLGDAAADSATPAPTSSTGDDGSVPSQQELMPYDLTMEQLEMEMSQEALGHVETVIGVGKAENLPPRAWVIALAVVAVESGFDPDACCDHTSVGLFQQLDGWGSEADRKDPATSSRMFYRGDGTNGLRPTMDEFPSWKTEQLWLIAGEAQEPDSCYGPNCEDLRLKYGKWERFAANLVLAHYGAAPIPGGGEGCSGPGGPAIGDYAFPLEHDSIQDTNWLTKPHHDYPAADIPVPTGTLAYAVTAGTISYADGSCGIGLTITSDDGVEYVYCHGESRSVSDGARVEAGDQVLVTASTGNSTGPHLHFGIRLSGESAERCPQDMLIALYNGEQPPDPHSAPTSGCSN